MVFKSSQDSSPKCSSKKQGVKNASTKLKARKCTPAPPTKEGDRKRFILSTLPEDKQLRKKIDFGDGDGTTAEGRKCKMAIFPSGSEVLAGKPGGGVPGTSIVLNEGVENSLQSTPIEVERSPEFSLAPANLESTVGGEAATLPHARGEDKENTMAKESLAANLVNFPELEMETRLLLEKKLVSNTQNNESRDNIVIEPCMQPNPLEMLQPPSLEMANDSKPFVETQMVLFHNEKSLEANKEMEKNILCES